MVDQCAGVCDPQSSRANYRVTEREREHFANWKDKPKKKKKSSKDKHYSFTVSNSRWYHLINKFHSLQVWGSESKKGTKDKKKALQDFVQRQNVSQSDVSLCCFVLDVFPSFSPSRRMTLTTLRKFRSRNPWRLALKREHSHNGIKAKSGRETLILQTKAPVLTMRGPKKVCILVAYQAHRGSPALGLQSQTLERRDGGFLARVLH
jgi:hypothetical protein